MARGPKKHLKRLNAPKHWMLSKLGGVYAPRPSSGPHKLRECLPLVVILRERLKYALTRREVNLIVMQRLVKIDGKVRTDTNYPAGFMDVLTLERTGENYRLLYDSKGRFVLHRISPEEATYKLCSVKSKALGSKASHGSNPYGKGRFTGIPYIVTHDGRTIRYPDPEIKIFDTVKVDIATGKIAGHYKFEPGQQAMIVRGNNVGRIGVIAHREHHPSSFDIIHLKDRAGHEFATRISNVFVIGQNEISLPKHKGVRRSILEERDAKLGKKEKAVKA